MTKISYDELEQMLRDPSVPDLGEAAGRGGAGTDDVACRPIR